MLAANLENFNMEDPEVEMEVEVEVAEVAEMAKESEKKPNEDLKRFHVRDGGGLRNVCSGRPSPPCAPPHVKGLGLRCYCQSCDEFCRRDEGWKCQHQSGCCQWQF